jgi:cytochrome c
MKRLLGLLGMLCLLAVPAGAAEERGGAADAQALVARAIAAYDAEGVAAFAAMTSPSTAFRDRDLYLFVADADNRVVAHGMDGKRVGADLAAQVDAAGTPFGKLMTEQASAEGVWIDYLWLDPITQRQVRKSSWVVRHDGYLFGCGIYRP